MQTKFLKNLYKINMLSPYVAYFLGILSIICPLLIFYVLTLNFTEIDTFWNYLFCSN